MTGVNSLKNYLLIFISFLALLAISGCASVSLQSSWKAPDLKPKQYRKLLVVGLSEKPQMRQIFEEVFVGEMSKKGAAGIASYTVTGLDAKATKASLEDAVKKSGADGVVITRLSDTKSHKDRRTGFVLTERGTYTDYNDDYGFYGANVSYMNFVHQPVDVTTSTEASIETTLFDAGTGNMVWSAKSNAVNPEGIINISKDVADIVIKTMSRDGLL